MINYHQEQNQSLNLTYQNKQTKEINPPECIKQKKNREPTKNITLIHLQNENKIPHVHNKIDQKNHIFLNRC